MAPPVEIKVEITPARLVRGKYLNLADCDGCHSPRDFSRFNGPVIASGRGKGNVFPPELGLPGMVAHTPAKKGKPLPDLTLAGGETFGFPGGMTVVSANITPELQTGKQLAL